MNYQQENNLKKFKKYFAFINTPFIKHGILASTLIICSIVLFMFLNSEGEKIADQWYENTKHYRSKTKEEKNKKQNINVNQIYDVLLDNQNEDESEDEEQKKEKSKSIINSKKTRNSYIDKFESTDAEKERIKQQLEIIELNATSHAQIIVFFYTRLFSELTLISITGIIAAICLFHISQSGWKQANNYVINVFVVTTGITLFIGALPIIFQQEKNIIENKELYINYVNLENEILTKLATKKNQNEKLEEPVKSYKNSLENEQIDLTQIILETEKKLKELNKISIGFDSTGVPQNSDVIKSLGINTQ